MTARAVVAAQVAADNPSWSVHPWPYLPEQVALGKPVVAIYRERLGRNGARLEHSLKIDLLVSLVGSEAAEDEADDALDQLLLSLQRLDSCHWTQVERVTFADAFTGYSVTAVMHSADPYKSAIAAEQRPPSKEPQA